jgi:hypothetical protein
MNLLQDYLKIKNLTIILMSVFTSLYSIYTAYSAHVELQVEKTKARQLSGFLSAKEIKLLEQKKKFNIAKGKLETSNKELNLEAIALRGNYTKLNKSYKKFISDNNLKLTQYEKRVYLLKQKIKSSKTAAQKVKIITKEGKCDKETVISYLYTDPLDRITFKTPNCLAKGGEEVFLRQSFVIYGEVHKQKDGLLKVSSLTLNEVESSNKQKIIATAKLLDSTFKFIDDSTIEKKPKPFLTIGVGYNPKHLQAFNLGYNFYNYLDLDMNLSLNYSYPNFVYPSLKAIYRPSILGRKLNLGVSAGAAYDFVTTPYYIVGVDFVAW